MADDAQVDRLRRVLKQRDALIERLVLWEPRAREAESELARAMEWKKIALHLADCHAATAQYEGLMARTSKRSRDRFASICEGAAAMLESGTFVRESHHESDRDETVQRLRDACKDLMSSR